MTLHAEPVVWTLRLYDEPDGYARHLPYRAVATASIMGDRALLAGLHGRFDRSGWRAIEDWLRAQGVTSAAMERRGRIVTLTNEARPACDTGAGAPIRSEARG